MFNSENNIIKAFVTSFILFFITIFIPKLHLHASTIKTIFDNNNLPSNSVGTKALRINDAIAVFATEFSDNFRDIKQNMAFVAIENHNSSYDWKRYDLNQELGLPLVITHNGKKIVIIGLDKNSQNLYTIIQDYEELKNSQNLFTSRKELLLLNFSEKLKNNFDIENMIISKSSSSLSQINYFWSGEDKNLLNIWLNGDKSLFVFNVDTKELKQHSLPIGKSDIKNETIVSQKLEYVNNAYYLVYDIDSSKNSSYYGISHKVFYSYNGETWHETEFTNNFGEYEVLLYSKTINNNIFYQSVKIDFTSFETTSTLWKASEILSPWNKLDTNLGSDAYILSMNQISGLYNIVTLETSSNSEYKIKYFTTKDLNKFDIEQAKPEINETVNTKYKSLFYTNLDDNNSIDSYLQKFTFFKLDKNVKNAYGMKFELLKVLP